MATITTRILTNLELYQGSTFNPVLQAVGSDGELIDWTGYTARMMARPDVASSTVLINLTTENGGITVDGTDVTLNISATTTAGYTFDTASYDVEMVNGAYVKRAWEGKITNFKEITRT